MFTMSAMFWTIITAARTMAMLVVLANSSRDKTEVSVGALER